MKEYKKYQYELTDEIAVKAWDTEFPDELGRPFLYQPHNPNGAAWESQEEAEQWVISLFEELLNPPVVEQEE